MLNGQPRDLWVVMIAIWYEILAAIELLAVLGRQRVVIVVVIDIRALVLIP